MKKGILFFAFFLILASAYSQKTDYAAFLIPDSLKANSNGVVRLDQIDIVISSQRKMKIFTKKAITIFNEKGLDLIDAHEFYDKSSSVNSIEATIYNGLGKEIKKIRRSDFKDQSATDGETMFSESRVIYLDYTPTDYPFTMVYTSEKTTSNTAFIPGWMPLTDYFVSVQKSILHVSYPENLGFKKKESNLSKFKIQKTVDTATQLSYEVTNIPAQKRESNSPSIDAIFPNVLLGLELFNLEGVDGSAKTWKEFGQWYYDKILTGTTEIPEETKSKIKALVGNETDPIKKAKIIYKYVQEKSRYVSIQVGIGGWKPMYAKDVDRLGYGDCKALTNYTKALLSVVDVPSYNTVLYGATDKRDIDAEFVSMQGNHMILSIPNGADYIWLECTSQDSPFGYQGTFTDDRKVVIIKPDGGEVVRTKVYVDKENKQISKGNYSLLANGDFLGSITIISEGTQYSQKAQVEKMQPSDKEAFYKDYWSNINNLKIDKSEFSNNKEKIALTENISLKAGGYGVINANTMMFAVNAFNQYSNIPQRYRTRNFPLEIDRGFLDVDEIEIVLPENYVIDAKPNNFELKDKFGEYKTEITVVNPSKIIYKRTLLINKGLYEKSDYENYRKFREQIAKADNSKIILTKKQG